VRTESAYCATSSGSTRRSSKKKGLRGKPGPAVHDDNVKRKFNAQTPNTLWLTDITEHRTDEGKLYLCAIKDVWSNRIVGYSIDSNMKATLAVRALHSAIGARPDHGCVLHSDRGSQFRSKKFVRTLTNNGLLGSMGRVGACRQRSDGVLFRVAAEECAGSAAVADTANYAWRS